MDPENRGRKQIAIATKEITLMKSSRRPQPRTSLFLRMVATLTIVPLLISVPQMRAAERQALVAP